MLGTFWQRHVTVFFVANAPTGRADVCTSAECSERDEGGYNREWKGEARTEFLRRERNRLLAKHRSKNGIASKHVKLRQTG